MAQVAVAVAKASSAAVREKMSEKDGDMAELSEGILEYSKLKRDAVIKNEVYINLVKQSEQARVQETMESMDIQVIDKANLPVEHSAPRRTLIAAIGLVLGCLISLGYGLWMYRKEYSL